MAIYELKSSRISIHFDNKTSASITNIKKDATADKVKNVVDAYLLLTENSLKEISKSMIELVKE